MTHTAGYFAINPENEHEARLFFCLIKAFELGENRHPQQVMDELAIKHGFRTIGQVPQSLFDGWDFWIEFDEPPELPPFFRENLPWKPVGEV